MFTDSFKQQQNDAWASIATQLATILGYGLFDTPQALARLTDLPRRLHDQFDRWVASLEHHARLLILAIALRMDPAPLKPASTRATKKRQPTSPDPDKPSTWRAVLRILPRLSQRTGRRSLPSKAARERRNTRLRQQREHQQPLRYSIDRHAALTGELRMPRDLKQHARNEAFLRELEDIEYGRVPDYDEPGGPCTYEQMIAAPWTEENEACYQELLALEGLAPDGTPLDAPPSPSFRPESGNPAGPSPAGMTSPASAPHWASAPLADAHYSPRLRAALAASAAEAASPAPASPKPRPTFPLARRTRQP
jgi:hypothetical protein